MSIKGFSVGGVVQRYDYTALDNLPQGQGVSDDLKAALLQLAQKVAYIDDQGQTYYDDLYDALYPEKTLLSITANFQQGQAVIYNTDSLDSLKQYLTVTAIYDDASTEIVQSSAYTLSGTLTTGTSVITVTYDGKTDAFNVTVTAAPMSFPVTNNLSGCTTSNSASNAADGSTYNAVITASSGYTLVGATVSITMGGQDITTSAYSGGIITINSVTGALVISVAAAAVVLNSISAVYTQSGTVYDNDTLDSLKTDLVVTATYSDSSAQIVPASDYTLSGTLTVGTSTITVSYGGKTATFSVTVTKGQVDTTAEVIRDGVVLGHFAGSNPYQDMNRTNGGVTKIYDLDAATTILAPAGIIPTTGNVMYQSNGPASLYILDASDNIVNFVSICASKNSFGRWCQNAEGTMTEYTQQWTVAQYSKIQFSVDTRYLDDAYMYDKTTGQVWFAGENTPYYGMTNISEAGGE